MLDLTWERSVPMIDVGLDEVKRIFADYDRDLTVIDFDAIRLGARNSNFAVLTNRGKYLLRMAPVNDINNEVPAFELMKDKVKVPDLLFHTRERDLNLLIYRYIDGLSLQKLIIDSGCEPAWLEQAAEAAASIHGIPKEKAAGFEEYALPPFETWHQIFLDHPKVKARLGGNLHKRTQRLVSDKQELLPEIDAYHSFAHRDFRPANMLVDTNDQVWFVDWEAAGTGHLLGDIGQFFRYRSFFSASHFERFEQVYNEHAIRRLPKNWVELSLFMDLVNPLQMLSANQEIPAKAADLIHVIEETLSYFGY